MKRKIIMLIVTVVFWALPAFGACYGVDMVYAATPSTFTTTPPSASPGNSVTQTGEKDVPLVPQSSPITHTHDFQYVTVQEASETQDAVIHLQCACGEVAERFTAPGSAAGAFIKQVVGKIMDAPKDAVVTVDTRIWTCYNQAVIDALSQRPDVTLVTNYVYNHVDYSITIPSGYDVSTLLDENGYCGFRYLDQVLGK